jgi:nicotinamide-nucleotide amidase
MNAGASSESWRRPRAATLAVGTEVTDGQIVDANSAWISARLVAAGVSVIEHRAVADERADIERALLELSDRVDLLFVTGGLGPTSDDFTRDLIAQVYRAPLEFDEASWRHVEQTLASRGVPVREIQRQQCFFPKGARVLTNPAGTANAFFLSSSVNSRRLQVYALPGPPAEIAAVWQAHIANEIESLLPVDEREELALIRFMGRGESQVAEVVEEVLSGTGIRVGYRAHLPYVEVKIWFTAGGRSLAHQKITEIEGRLRPWFINRGEQDVADGLIDWIGAQSRKAPGFYLKILDSATAGVLHNRITQRLKMRQLLGIPISVETDFTFSRPQLTVERGGVGLHLSADPIANLWRIRMILGSGDQRVIEESPTFNYKVANDRARQYITERFFLSVAKNLAIENN